MERSSTLRSAIRSRFLNAIRSRIFLPSTLLAFSPAGSCGAASLYVMHNSQLFRSDANGHRTLVGSGFGGQASDMIFGPDGALYVSMFDGADKILRLMPNTPVSVRVDDGRGGFDTQCFVIDVVPKQLADLSIATIDKSGLLYDGQALTVGGNVSCVIKNNGPGAFRRIFRPAIIRGPQLERAL